MKLICIGFVFAFLSIGAGVTAQNKTFILPLNDSIKLVFYGTSLTAEEELKNQFWIGLQDIDYLEWGDSLLIHHPEYTFHTNNGRFLADSSFLFTINQEYIPIRFKRKLSNDIVYINSENNDARYAAWQRCEMLKNMADHNMRMKLILGQFGDNLYLSSKNSMEELHTQIHNAKLGINGIDDLLNDIDDIQNSQLNKYDTIVLYLHATIFKQFIDALIDSYGADISQPTFSIHISGFNDTMLDIVNYKNILDAYDNFQVNFTDL